MKEIMNIRVDKMINEPYGVIINKLVDSFTKSAALEYREEKAKEFWLSLTDEELEMIQAGEEATVLVTLGLKCLFFTDDPFTHDVEMDKMTIETECNSVIFIASIQGLINKGFIVSNGEYFYNPFGESDARFTTPDKEYLLFNEKESQFNRMMGNG